MSEALQTLETGWAEMARGEFSAEDLGIGRSRDLAAQLAEAYEPGIRMAVRAVASCYRRCAPGAAAADLVHGDEVFPGAYLAEALARAHKAAWDGLHQIMETSLVTPVTEASGDRTEPCCDPCAVALNAAQGAAHTYFMARQNEDDRAAGLLDRASLLGDLAMALGAPLGSDESEALIAGSGLVRLWPAASL